MTHPLLPIPVLFRLTAIHERGGFLSARGEPLKAGGEHRAVEVRERVPMEYRGRMEGGAAKREIPLISERTIVREGVALYYLVGSRVDSGLSRGGMETGARSRGCWWAGAPPVDSPKWDFTGGGEAGGGQRQTSQIGTELSLEHSI
jgi:hypothetical protein